MLFIFSIMPITEYEQIKGVNQRSPGKIRNLTNRSLSVSSVTAESLIYFTVPQRDDGYLQRSGFDCAISQSAGCQSQRHVCKIQ